MCRKRILILLCCVLSQLSCGQDSDKKKRKNWQNSDGQNPDGQNPDGQQPGERSSTPAKIKPPRSKKDKSQGSGTKKDEKKQTGESKANRWDQLAWLDKAARTLRSGKGLSSDDDIGKLLSMKRRDAVREFMKTPEFVDTVYHFNLYFLGFYQTPADGTSIGGVDSRAVQYPSAVASARAIGQGGDYLALFDYSQNLVLEPVFFADGFDETVKKFREGLAILKKSYAKDPREKFCATYDETYLGEAIYVGLPDAFTEAMNDANHLGKIDIYCISGKGSLVGHFAFVEDTFDRLLGIARQLDNTKYDPQHIEEFIVKDAQKVGLDSSSPFTEEGFWLSHANSSTNFNRSRAAYILEKFFCDDLTPINVETPEDHASDLHASDPGCQSCHYKLDPMAGFFKSRGFAGNDFTGQTEIFLDDGVRFALKDYEANWRDKNGKWIVGYVRSVNNRDLNSYGQNLKDLFAIAKQAPEVKACLTQKMFEFFVADEQAVDRAYLAELTAEFEDKPSTEAFKNIAEKLVLSETFAVRDPVSTVCYDFARGAKREGRLEGRPPCEIAHVLDQNCATCHGDNAPSAGLSLTKWINLPGGGASFQHLNDDGKQQSKLDTFTAIQTALESSDPAERMPMNRHMSAQDREKLYLWVNNKILEEGR